MRALFTLLVFAAAAGAGGWYWYRTQNTSTVPNWNKATVDRGNIDLTIRSTGTLEPREVVDVGAQVVGMVKQFGEDKTMPGGEIYWNSKVDVGTVLAVIDDSIYKAQLDLATANMESAKAKVVSAQATLKDDAADFERAKLKFAKNAISQSDLDAAEASYETAKANVDVAVATVAQDEATMNLAKTNEDYTIIKSPVKGTIIDRRVNIGQTVVASLSAPSLFLIAQDLTKLQIWASVSEADIGQIHEGQKTTFKVDAWGEQVFNGTVSQVRLNATMNQNVVTYTVVVDTDNSDGKLKPYQTATIEFDAGRHDNVLMVPNAALQWRPVGQQLAYVAPESRTAAGGHHSHSTDPNSAAKKSKDKLDRGTVWVFDGQWLRPEHVKIGVTDQVNTEIISGDVNAGDQVVLGEEHGAVDADATENPFRAQKSSKRDSRPTFLPHRTRGADPMELIRIENLFKTYFLGEVDVPVLKGVSITIVKGEMVALMGVSGSGKSTLMNILGLLDRPTSGGYWLNGQEVSRLSADRRAKVRNRNIGFVFQSFNLLPRSTAIEQVRMPAAGLRGHALGESRRTPPSDHVVGERRPRTTARSRAVAALRRSAATCGHFARPGESSADSAGRRANRKSRFAHQRRNLADVSAIE